MEITPELNKDAIAGIPERRFRASLVMRMRKSDRLPDYIERADRVRDEIHQAILRRPVPQTRGHPQRSVVLNGDGFRCSAHSTPLCALL